MDQSSMRADPCIYGEREKERENCTIQIPSLYIISNCIIIKITSTKRAAYKWSSNQGQNIQLRLI